MTSFWRQNDVKVTYLSILPMENAYDVIILENYHLASS